MFSLTAVYLDLTDLQSARVWGWLRLLGLREGLEVRPFCLAVEDPWDSDSPPFGLELLMLLEQAREHGEDRIDAVLDASFSRISPDVETAHEELAVWLEVGRIAGLDLGEYDDTMQRLRAEVGLWQAEAIDDHGIQRAPTLLFDDGTTIYLQLDADLETREDAEKLWCSISERMAIIAPSDMASGATGPGTGPGDARGG